MSAPTVSAPPIKLRWVIGLLAGFALFAVVAAYSSRMAKNAPDYDGGRATERYATLKKLRETDEKTLTTADWVDQAKGIVRLPVDEAVPQTVAALKAKPVGMGAEIPGNAPAKPAPAQNQAPAGTTNAAPAAPKK